MAEREEIITRLRRIEGQVRGLVRMVEGEEECGDILTQLLAARAALDKAALRIVGHYLERCLPNEPTFDDVQHARQNLERVLKLMMRMQ